MVTAHRSIANPSEVNLERDATPSFRQGDAKWTKRVLVHRWDCAHWPAATDFTMDSPDGSCPQVHKYGHVQEICR